MVLSVITVAWRGRDRDDSTRGTRPGSGPQAWCAEWCAVQELDTRPGAFAANSPRRLDGDRQMVKILTTVLSEDYQRSRRLASRRCAKASHSADVIINILARRREPEPLITIATPEAPTAPSPAADATDMTSLRRVH